jgi:hypothetical protein
MSGGVDRQPIKEESDDDLHDAVPAKRRGTRNCRQWLEAGAWDPVAERAEFIDQEILRIATETMQISGITKLSTMKVLESDLHCWKLRDHHFSPNEKAHTYRYCCPLKTRCKCPAMLRVTRHPHLITLEQSMMHDLTSHTSDKDVSKKLKWQQREDIASAISESPMSSSKSIRRTLHRNSLEKRIDISHKR